MSEDKKSRSSNVNYGLIGGLSRQVRLVLRLIGDGRVNPLLKLLPLGTLAYLLFPDPIIGPIDDAGVIGLGTMFFIEMCPPDVVAEHRADLWGNDDGSFDETVVDTEFTESSE